jgi:sporulation related protein
MEASRRISSSWRAAGAACGLFAGCAFTAPPRNVPAPEAAPPDAATPYDVESEGEFPPPPPVDPEPASATWEAAPAGGAPAVRWQPGFRVQVFACAARDGAEIVRREVAGRIDAPTYVEYEAPYYRVRVGDCRTEAECRDLEARLRQAGYASAWTVATHILSP